LNILLLYNSTLTDLKIYQNLFKLNIDSFKYNLSLSWIENFEYNTIDNNNNDNENINKILINNNMKKFIKNFYNFYNLFDLNIYYQYYNNNNKKRKINEIDLDL
jgi:hypothetical protein